MAIAAVSPVVTERPLCGQHVKTTYGPCSAKVREWPQVMRGGLAWGGDSLPSEEDTILNLTESEINEVKAAVEHFNGVSSYSFSVTEDQEADHTRIGLVW